MTDAELREWLVRLVRLPTDASEAAQAEALAAFARDRGAQVTLHEVKPGRVNVVARFAGARPGPAWLFEAHGDTVGGAARFERDDARGRLYGRGACDTKGALAAMLAACVRASASGALRGSVQLASTCCEETGGDGARALMAAGLRADAAVVGEPTRLEVVRAHKGAWRTRLTTRGRAAHSSAPGKGVSAISLMFGVIRELETRFAGELAAVSDPLLGAPTLSVGTIRGGRAVNIVPDECVIEVDWRLVPETPAERLLERLRARLPGTAVEPYEYYPPFCEPADAPVVAAAARAVAAVTGRPAVLGGAPWAANAGIFQEACGLPCVILGPGDIAQAHTAEESVDWREVEAAARVYERLLTQEDGGALQRSR